MRQGPRPEFTGRFTETPQSQVLSQASQSQIVQEQPPARRPQTADVASRLLQQIAARADFNSQEIAERTAADELSQQIVAAIEKQQTILTAILSTIQIEVEEAKTLLKDVKEFLEQGQGMHFQDVLHAEMEKIPTVVAEEVAKMVATIAQKANKELQVEECSVVTQSAVIGNFEEVVSPVAEPANAFDPYAEIVSDATQKMMARARRKRRYIAKLRQ